jgi:thioredoxin-like negative regulator of GroEL
MTLDGSQQALTYPPPTPPPLQCDVDEQEKVAQEVGIRAMPTFMVFKNGEKIETVVGADPGKLQAAITKHSS